ncbi:hypothetical protein QBC39DRAFT_132823 [Podospora conica]|nr:hypothetical protein QBC39DRAFT_132823 [Schizothecium conicum]
MSSEYAISRFNLTCPTGGQFHICTGSPVPFLGCCTVDPCTTARGGVCPLDNLRTSSFNPDTYTDLPRQDCDDAESIRIWYTCKFNNPPFVGCCASNPCAEGLCAPADLRPAKLSGDEALRGLFLNPVSTSAGTTSTAVPSATGSETAAPNATGSLAPALPAPVMEEKAGGITTGAIVGIVAGVVALAVIVFGAYKFGGARRKKGRGLLPQGGEYQQAGSRDSGQQGAGEGYDIVSAHRPGVHQSHFRDSTFSGSTAFSPPMTQHATFASPYGAKSVALSSPEFGRHSFVSEYTTTGNPYGNFPTPYHHAGVPAVELPVEAQSAQELPASEPTSHMSPQYAPSELFSGDSTPQVVSPLPSPRFPDEQPAGQGGTSGYSGRP